MEANTNGTERKNTARTGVGNHGIVPERRAIPGYEGAYEVDATGRVFSLARRVEVRRGGKTFTTAVAERQLSLQTDRYGYKIATLCKDGNMTPGGVHRWLCMAFHGTPPEPGMHAAHIDGVKTNNTPENVRWATPAENNEDRRVHGVHPMGERLPHTKLTAAKVREVVALSRQGVRTSEIARKFGVSGVAVSKVLLGKSWRQVTGFTPHPDILAEIECIKESVDGPVG